MRVRIHTALILFFSVFALYAAVPVHAGPFDGLIPKDLPNPFKGVDLGKQAQDFLRDRLGKALGEEAPFVIDPNQAFRQAPADQVPASDNFKPTPLKTVSDLNRPLPPGDYTFNAMFYCTQWSVHRPGRGHPYTIGRAQGRLAKQMSALLYRGTVKHVAPSTMNAMAWRIQAGVPLNQWPDQDKALVHELTPEYENDLQGDWLQKIEDDYNKTFHFVTRKSFNDELQTLGDLGHLALNLESAHQTLTDRTVVDERLPDLMFQKFGAGGSPQLSPDPDHPSPWMSVAPGITARFTVQEGNLGNNTMDLHITPEATQNGKGPTLSEIVDGTGEGDDTGLVGYSPDSQSPLINPNMGDDPTVASIALKLDKPEVDVNAAITGTAIPENSSGKPVSGASVNLTFAEKTTGVATNKDANTGNLGSTTANGDKYAFSFSPNDTPGTVLVTASVEDSSLGTASSNVIGNSAFSIIPSANAAENNAPTSITATGQVSVKPVTEADKFSVKDIPDIMKNIATNNPGWYKGAELLDHWFEGNALVDWSDASHPAPNWGLPIYYANVSGITMDWLLSPANSTNIDGNYNGRVKEAYEALLDSKSTHYFATKNAIKALAANIKFSQKFGNNQKIIKFPFPDVTESTLITSAVHTKNQTQYSAIDEKIQTLDPVTTTIGNFHFYLIPCGEASIGQDGIHIKIDRLAIYAIKNYHFNDHLTPITDVDDPDGLINFFGSWKKPDKVTRNPYPLPFSGYFPIYEKDFQNWRLENKKGGDYLLVSNVRIVNLEPPFKTKF